MTDKVQKIKKWVRIRKLCTMDEHMKFYCKEAESDYNLLCSLEKFLDSMQEEPVSEDLEEAALVYSATDIITEEGKLVIDSEKVNAFKAGAKWQFNQFEKNRLAACDRATDEEIKREQNFVDKIIIGEHRQPTYSDAIEYGIKWQKEIDDNAKRQIHKNAVEYGKSQMLNAACEYLIAHSLLAKPIIDDFRKALEED